ncbi:hypothetical protein CCP2SC5_2270002 [Azospirillaceae bacterium]
MSHEKLSSPLSLDKRPTMSKTNRNGYEILRCKDCKQGNCFEYDTFDQDKNPPQSLTIFVAILLVVVVLLLIACISASVFFLVKDLIMYQNLL